MGNNNNYKTINTNKNQEINNRLSRQYYSHETFFLPTPPSGNKANNNSDNIFNNTNNATTINFFSTFHLPSSSPSLC